jgi:hypothetical protein
MKTKIPLFVLVALVLGTSCQKNIEQSLFSSPTSTASSYLDSLMDDKLVAAMGVTKIKQVSANQYKVYTNVFGREKLFINVLSSNSEATITKIQNLTEDSVFVFTNQKNGNISVSAYKNDVAFTSSKDSYTKSLLSDADSSGLAAMVSSCNTSYYGVMTCILKENNYKFKPYEDLNQEGNAIFWANSRSEKYCFKDKNKFMSKTCGSNEISPNGIMFSRNGGFKKGDLGSTFNGYIHFECKVDKAIIN